MEDILNSTYLIFCNNSCIATPCIFLCEIHQSFILLMCELVELQQHGSSTSKKFKEFEYEFNNSMIFVSVFDRCSQYIQKLQGWCHFWVKAAQDRWWKWAVFCQIFDQSKPLATAAKWLQLQTLHSHTVSHIVPIPKISSKVQEVREPVF